jgi:hypothetical protein
MILDESVIKGYHIDMSRMHFIIIVGRVFAIAHFSTLIEVALSVILA